MFKVILIAISTILIGLVIIYSWLNRDSDRVILTLVTAISISALGFITKESISNKLETASKEFPVAVFFAAPDYKPLNIKLPYHFDLSMCLQNIPESELPKNESGAVDISFAQEKYFDAIQFVLVKSIFEKFGQGWNVKVRRTHTPNGMSLSWQNSESTGNEILLKDFLSKIENNFFIDNDLIDTDLGVFGGKAIFPPDLLFEIQESKDTTGNAIKLKTKYISMDIILSKSSSSMGIGEYSKFFNIPSAFDRRNGPEANKYGNSVFLVQTNIKQNYWLNGHPEMKKYRNWADSIAELLDTKFNFETIRSEHLRSFQLHGVNGIKEISLTN
jgi:hypothetical protein